MKKIMFNDRYGLTSAVLEGRKTMTRRIIPGIIQGSVVITDVYNGSITHFAYNEEAASRGDGSAVWTKLVPKYKVGEVVAVAQSYKDAGFDGEAVADSWAAKSEFPGKWNTLPGFTNKMFVQSEFMPHHIRITNIHIERLQDISDEDCMKEGIMEGEFMNTWDTFYYDEWGDVPNHITFKSPRKAFAILIDKVSGKGTWASNPWVFVYEFELVI